jgi:uncharacterized delta-60 repeat protein
MRVALLLLMLCGVAIARPTRPPPCSPGHFVLQGGPLFTDVADSVLLVIADGEASIGSACTGGSAHIARAKRRSKLAAHWKACPAAHAVVRIKGRFDPGCDVLSGTISGRKLHRRPFTATRSRCTDGVWDPGNGETCDAGAGCEAPLHCSDACACVGDPGSRDMSFGSFGVLTVGRGGQPFYLQAILVEPDGGFVVAGNVGLSTTNDGSIGLARFGADGGLDATFGDGGWTVTLLAPQVENVSAAALQADGKIVVAGKTDTGAHRFVARYDAGGHLDPLFGVGGVVKLDSAPCYESSPSLAVVPDGGILAAYPDVNCFSGAAIVARLNGDGALDPGFGSLGLVHVPTAAVSITARPDGRFAFSTFSAVPTAVRVFGPDGTPDAGFGAAGAVFPLFGTSAPSSVILAADSQSRLVGACQTPVSGGSGFGLLRWTADGSYDSTFGSGGRVVTPGSGNEYPFALAFDRSDRILVVGSRMAGTSYDTLVRRYRLDGTLDAAFAGGEAVLPSTLAAGVAILPDGKILVAADVLPSSGQPFEYAALARLWP